MSKGRSKNKTQRSSSSLPKGIPQHYKRGGGGGLHLNVNPFETARSTNSALRVKHPVHNKTVPGQNKLLANNNSNLLAAAVLSQQAALQHQQSSLAKSIARRKQHLSHQLSNQGKANVFIDRRIGEQQAYQQAGVQQQQQFYQNPNQEDVMLKRIVQERVRRSKKRDRFHLTSGNDNDDNHYDGLTHRGQTIDEHYSGAPIDHHDILLSDEDEEDLDKVDTMLHFGGGKFDSENRKERGAYNNYGITSGEVGGRTGTGGELGQVYRSRREELEDRIQMKKMVKAEKLKRKEDQAGTFETMDESFAELAQLLNFRDKEQERVQRSNDRKNGKLSKDDMEMDDWDKEMKEYLFTKKVKATDRTKTPEEMAKEEAEKLHALESKRLARMAGDFLSEDEFSDISDEEGHDGGGSGGGRRKKRRKRDKKDNNGGKRATKDNNHSNPEELGDYSDDDNNDENASKKKREVRFTADGLVYVDKQGNVLGKVGEEDDETEVDGEGSEDDSNNEDEDEDNSSDDDGMDGNNLGDTDDEASAVDDDDEDDASCNSDKESTQSEDSIIELKVGMAIQGNYRAKEQLFENKEEKNWINGTITSVRNKKNGQVVYDVTYDDGDFEEGIAAENVRPVPKSSEEKKNDEKKGTEAEIAKQKKQKAKLRARESIPFVFEVPTTLEALHDLISKYASTGADASLIIQRIHATNSVRLNHKNKEKMQNYYDVLLRRFVAVGDAIFQSGNGGPDLDRYEQLNSLTKTLYAMSQDSPECAGAVWSRRLGIFQKALSKRLRDVEVTPLGDACQDEFTAWPSTGMILLMRALPQIFPSTDRQHAVVTPGLLLLGQILAQTPIKTRYDVVMGLFSAGLMLEYTKGAKRVPPEATAFLAGVLRLFADDQGSALANSPLPSFSNSDKSPQLATLRSMLSNDEENARFSLERDEIQSDANSMAILNAALHLCQQAITNLGNLDHGSEREIYRELTQSLLLITGKRKEFPFPQLVKRRLAEVARVASGTCASNSPRLPLQRRKSASIKELAVKTLTPRIEDPTRYSMSKDKGKSQSQAEHDRNRREYKREHKAAMRELRLDSAFIEEERRKAKNAADSKAREKRNKNYAWLESEQATLNQQVRLGGGLLSGGGIGAAKAKAKSRTLGIKKGGKL